MCIDYIDLNKVCLKDSFPLPQIDQLVDSVLGHEVLPFLDAYSGYNQILMHPRRRKNCVYHFALDVLL